MSKPIPFGNYLLLERVNVGGMAEVFKAKAFGVEGFERLVAVKRILPSIAEDQEFITMFIDEAKIAVQLTHANIAQIFDLGKAADSYFIAMEFCAGKDGRAIFDRGRKIGEPIPIPMACYIIMKVCEGLDYAHNKKDTAGRDLQLVHRDVSPQNVLISWDGEVKIIDFGIAKAANKAGKTQAGILKGKFGYMSPEQVRGLPIDRRSDVFAVGICLYELLTGERLFYGETDFETLQMVRNVEMVPPSTYNKSIPQELETIVLKALAKDTEERYQTAMDLHDDLQSFMYTSGNFFARKDLSAFMRDAFASAIARESARDEQYRRIKAPQKSAGEAGGASPPPSAPSKPARKKDDMAKVPPPPPPGGRSSKPSKPSTIQGHAPPLPPSSTVSNPPPLPGGPPLPPSAAPAPPVSDPGAVDMGMDWDDEDDATQIYSAPDSLPPPAMSSPGMMAAPIVSDSPSIPGNPSPFDDLPAPSRDSDAGQPHDKTAVTASPKKPAREKGEEGRSGMGMLILALVVLLALLAGAAWFLLGPKTPGVVHLTTDPHDAQVFVDQQQMPGSGSPWVVSVTPGESHVLEVRAEGRETWLHELNLAPGQQLTLPAVELVPADGEGGGETGGFTLNTSPTGATVFVDDERVGVTPVTANELSAGTHRVRIEMDGHGTWEDEITIAAGALAAMPTVELSPAQVAVTFQSTPTGASVVLIGANRERRIGSTPTEIDVDLENGPYRVRMSLDGYDTYEEPMRISGAAREHTVEVRLRRPRDVRPAGMTSVGNGGMTSGSMEQASTETMSGSDTMTMEMEPATTGTGPGTLRINTRPWSQVYVDGRLVGNTPQMNIRLPAGSHRVTMVNPDQNIRRSISVNIQPGQTTTRVITLQRSE